MTRPSTGLDYCSLPEIHPRSAPPAGLVLLPSDRIGAFAGLARSCRGGGVPPVLARSFAMSLLAIGAVRSLASDGAFCWVEALVADGSAHTRPSASFHANRQTQRRTVH